MSSPLKLRPDSPPPWLFCPDSPKSSEDSSPQVSPKGSPKFSNRIIRPPSPFYDVVPTFWNKAQTIWLDFFSHESDRKNQFLNSVEGIENAVVMELPRSLSAKSQNARWCVRISSPLKSLDDTFTVLFEAYPNLFGYLYPVVKKQITSET